MAEAMLLHHVPERGGQAVGNHDNRESAVVQGEHRVAGTRNAVRMRDDALSIPDLGSLINDGIPDIGKNDQFLVTVQ